MNIFIIAIILIFLYFLIRWPRKTISFLVSLFLILLCLAYVFNILNGPYKKTDEPLAQPLHVSTGSSSKTSPTVAKEIKAPSLDEIMVRMKEPPVSYKELALHYEQLIDQLKQLQRSLIKNTVRDIETKKDPASKSLVNLAQVFKIVCTAMRMEQKRGLNNYAAKFESQMQELRNNFPNDPQTFIALEEAKAIQQSLIKVPDNWGLMLQQFEQDQKRVDSWIIIYQNAEGALSSEEIKEDCLKQLTELIKEFKD